MKKENYIKATKLQHEMEFIRSALYQINHSQEVTFGQPPAPFPLRLSMSCNNDFKHKNVINELKKTAIAYFEEELERLQKEFEEL